MSKTALQELIAHMETSMFSTDPIFEHAKSLLAKEREQIIQSFHEGQRSIIKNLIEILPNLDFSYTLNEFEKVDSGHEHNEEALAYFNSKYGGVHA